MGRARDSFGVKIKSKHSRDQHEKKEEKKIIPEKVKAQSLPCFSAQTKALTLCHAELREVVVGRARENNLKNCHVFIVFPFGVQFSVRRAHHRPNGKPNNK